MRNTNNLLHLHNSKVINLKSETLFRQAEDDFYYFNNINSALKKLKEAILLSPYHLKSLILCADIYFIKGKIKNALELYLRALNINPDCARTNGAAANCYYSLKQFNSALSFAQKSLDNIDVKDYQLYYQVIEIKINSLVELKEYKPAYITFIQSQNILDRVTLNSIYNSNFDIINEKLKLQNKIKDSGLKIV